MQTISLDDLGTLAVLVPFVMLVTQVILNAAAWDAATSNRWGPIVAMAVGVLAAVGAQVALGPVTSQSVGQALLTGVVAGATAMGGHAIVTKSVVGSVASRALGVMRDDAVQPVARAAVQPALYVRRPDGTFTPAPPPADPPVAV